MLCCKCYAFISHCEQYIWQVGWTRNMLAPLSGLKIWSQRWSKSCEGITTMEKKKKLRKCKGSANNITLIEGKKHFEWSDVKRWNPLSPRCKHHVQIQGLTNIVSNCYNFFRKHNEKRNLTKGINCNKIISFWAKMWKKFKRFKPYNHFSLFWHHKPRFTATSLSYGMIFPLLFIQTVNH